MPLSQRFCRIPVLVMLFGLAPLACGDDSPVAPLPPGASLRVSPSLDTIFVADTITAAAARQLVARVSSATGAEVSGHTLHWSSADISIAEVDQTGRVFARGIGSTTITVEAGEKARATIVVAPATTDIVLTPATPLALVGDTVQLTARALDRSGQDVAGVRYVFTSNAPTVATVDSLGRVIPVGAGTAEISVEGNGASASLNVEVFPRAFVNIAAGIDFTCGTLPLGRLSCFGLSETFQLAVVADSLCFDQAVLAEPARACTLLPIRGPAEVSLASVSAGGGFACGIATNSAVMCWGTNELGQLGRGTVSQGEAGIASVFGSSNFATVSAGGAHSCAVTPAGAAYCWGADESGQLGDAKRVHSTTPIPVVGGEPIWREVSAGSQHTCGIGESRTAYCWGSGTNGRLGTGSTDTSDVPLTVSGGRQYRAIAAGARHSCAVALDGVAYCWGSNHSGQIGKGDVVANQNVLMPAATSTAARFTAISAGDDFTCALATTGAIHCWGLGDWRQLGRGNTTTSSGTPQAIMGGLTFQSVSAGRRHVCGVATDGETYCWGSDVYGALGNELQANMRGIPQRVATPR